MADEENAAESSENPVPEFPTKPAANDEVDEATEIAKVEKAVAALEGEGIRSTGFN